MKLVYTHVAAAVAGAFAVWWLMDTRADIKEAKLQEGYAQVVAHQEKINADTVADFHTAIRALDDFNRRHPVTVRVPRVCPAEGGGTAGTVDVSPSDVVLTFGGVGRADAGSVPARFSGNPDPTQ